MNARSRKDARHMLEVLSKAVVTHLLKILIFPQGAVNHWRNELSGMAKILRGYHKASGPSGQNYSLDMFLEYLYTDMIDNLPLGFVPIFEEEYGPANTADLVSRLEKAVKEFYDLVSN